MRGSIRRGWMALASVTALATLGDAALSVAFAIAHDAVGCAVCGVAVGFGIYATVGARVEALR